MEYHKCRMCDNKYEMDKGNRAAAARDIETYSKYLGFCHMDCWNKLAPKWKDEEIVHAYIYGNIRNKNSVKIHQRKLQDKELKEKSNI